MRKARYDLQKVICKNSSFLGYSSNVAKPGYWITTAHNVYRVLGRVTEPNPKPMIAAVRLSKDLTFAHVVWVNPDDVTQCEEKPPAWLMAWITAPQWVRTAKDIHRIVAMSAHGTLSEQFIETRDDPEKAYNRQPGYVDQFILKD